MNKIALLIAGMALVASSLPAAAEAPSLRGLPKAMLGGWCATGQHFSDGDTWSNSTYQRRPRSQCKGDWMQLGARGYVESIGEDVICRFATINQIDKDRFAITARCQSEEAPSYNEEMMFSLSGKVLTGSVKLRNE